ncbi:hypothetical protein [Flavobacterium sp. GT3R68]|uniref:hypothetical protein n=1 Tax=Flavobacterium sp. GT3R68 TaxID=2594437 RepID=UPI000F8670C8|nr:hypothetical protein [Flavobacterium sp. GT3R68]RTY95239.1 hypothetical protein EKL32_07355 [Flavobacterium sp. GSN2]TRW91019.1 hypothetical protein FNW07_09315 [Flavobacterium sp. GT3R68]
MIQDKLQLSHLQTKRMNLIFGLLFDLIGMLSFTIPLLGEFSDVIWAPVSAYLMTRMYKGTLGKLGGIFSFVEEIFPFSDFIPSFTLMWVYKYVINNKNAQ